jgi:hypothetical protein
MKYWQGKKKRGVKVVSFANIKMMLPKIAVLLTLALQNFNK